MAGIIVFFCGMFVGTLVGITIMAVAAVNKNTVDFENANPPSNWCGEEPIEKKEV